MLSTTRIQPFGRYTDIHASYQKLKTQEKEGCANCQLKIPQNQPPETLYLHLGTTGRRPVRGPTLKVDVLASKDSKDFYV